MNVLSQSSHDIDQLTDPRFRSLHNGALQKHISVGLKTPKNVADAMTLWTELQEMISNYESFSVSLPHSARHTYGWRGHIGENHLLTLGVVAVAVVE